MRAHATKLGRCLALGSLILAALACASGRAADEAADVLATDRARLAAMVAVDLAGLDATLHEGLTYTHSNGRLDTKASLVESLVSGGVDYLDITLDVEAQVPQVRVRGETAVVTAAARMQVAAAGAIHDLTLVYTAVYFREDGRWQLAAYQSAPAAR